MELGSAAPLFCLPDREGNDRRLSDFKGKWVILYFYPKDNTSGCTREAIDFSEQLPELEKNGAIVIGISPDSPASHQKFFDKHQLRVLLLSDQSHQVAEKYEVWKLKRMYGKEYYGIERSTFLITPGGELAREWRRVKVKGHVDEVKRALQMIRQ
jgi:thioredoxin-dependent peroxiredoxin